MAYTQDGIMAQIWVAFGQGTGSMRVEQEAALELRTLYYDLIDAAIIADWETIAVQILERMRAIGRLAASTATDVGATAITAEDVASSAQTVQQSSGTPQCPPNP